MPVRALVWNQYLPFVLKIYRSANPGMATTRKGGSVSGIRRECRYYFLIVNNIVVFPMLNCSTNKWVEMVGVDHLWLWYAPSLMGFHVARMMVDIFCN